MNLKVLVLLLFYYSVISLFFIFASGESNTFPQSSWNTSLSLNDSAISPDEQDSGGFFSTGISITRFLMFISVGIGISAPTWFQIMFSAWTVIINILAIGFVISAIWNG